MLKTIFGKNHIQWAPDIQEEILKKCSHSYADINLRLFTFFMNTKMKNILIEEIISIYDLENYGQVEVLFVHEMSAD